VIIRPALPGTRNGVDTVQAVRSSQATQLAALGIDWVARYMPIDGRRLDTPDDHGGDWQGCWTLSLSELHELVGAGLGVVPVQWGPRGAQWFTDPLMASIVGTSNGAQMAAAARWLGIPEGCHLFADVEGARAMAVGKQALVEYMDGWSAAVLGAGYRAGMYYSGTPLLVADLDRIGQWVSAFWRSAVRTDARPSHGLRIQQHYESPYPTPAGVQVDYDTTIAPPDELPLYVCAAG
jgi:hypothetical protein